MKIAATISRYLLGLVFFVFGLNGFLHFIKGAPPPGPAGDFVNAMITTHFWIVVSLVQTLGGLLLLVNRYVVFALVILGPVIVNIFFFHLFMAPQGLPLASVVVILWIILAVRNKQHLSGIFVQRSE